MTNHVHLLVTPSTAESLPRTMQQKQRVLLARALYRRPKVLVLDEGTAHLDTELEARVSNAITELDITRIVIAHRPETIRRASRAVLLAGGKIHRVELGGPHAVNLHSRSESGTSVQSRLTRAIVPYMFQRSPE